MIRKTNKKNYSDKLILSSLVDLVGEELTPILSRLPYIPPVLLKLPTGDIASGNTTNVAENTGGLFTSIS